MRYNKKVKGPQRGEKEKEKCATILEVFPLPMHPIYDAKPQKMFFYFSFLWLLQDLSVLLRYFS